MKKEKKILYALYHQDFYDKDYSLFNDVENHQTYPLFFTFIRNVTIQFLKEMDKDYVFNKYSFKQKMISMYLSFILKDKRNIDIFKYDSYKEIVGKQYNEDKCEFIKILEKDGNIIMKFSNHIFDEKSNIVRIFIKTLMSSYLKNQKESFLEEDLIITFSVNFLSYLEDIYNNSDYFDSIGEFFNEKN